MHKIFNVMYSNGTCPSTKGQDGTITRLACPDAYGYVLGTTIPCLPGKIASDNPTGTSIICAFLEILMSLVSPKVLQRIFPPMVTGTVILMIGASLVGASGIPNWGGGSNDCRSRPETGFFQFCPNIAAPKPKLCVCFHDHPNKRLIISQVGISRIHRSRFRLLRFDHFDGNFWISIPKEHQHHRGFGCGMHRRRCYRLYRRQQYPDRPSHHFPLVRSPIRIREPGITSPYPGFIRSESECILQRFSLCWLYMVVSSPSEFFSILNSEEQFPWPWRLSAISLHQQKYLSSPSTAKNLIREFKAVFS